MSKAPVYKRKTNGSKRLFVADTQPETIQEGIHSSSEEESPSRIFNLSLLNRIEYLGFPLPELV